MHAQWFLFCSLLEVKIMKDCIFSRLELFPYVFRQVKEWLTLQLHEMIRLPHAVACPIVFYFIL